MTMTLGTLLKQLLARNLKAFPMSMYYVYHAYADRIDTDHKLIFSSRNSLFKDSSDCKWLLKNTNPKVLKLAVISAKIDGDYCYIRVDC